MIGNFIASIFCGGFFLIIIVKGLCIIDRMLNGKNWRVVYHIKDYGKKQSYPMIKREAMDYMLIFRDAICIQNIKNGKRIYK